MSSAAPVSSATTSSATPATTSTTTTEMSAQVQAQATGAHPSVEEKKEVGIVLEDDHAPEEEKKKKKTRREITIDTVQAQFTQLQKMLEDQIELLRNQEAPKAGGAKGIKFLKSVNKRVKDLSKDVVRLNAAKSKRPKRAGNTASGFLKPVRIAQKMCDFAGWKEGETHSRIDVTKSICAYVKEKGLQNPVNKREIVPDEKLRTLLNYDPSTNPTPLTYFSLQKLIQPLFPDSKSQVALRAQLESQQAQVQA